MEWASYELPAKTADRAEEPDVARVLFEEHEAESRRQRDVLEQRIEAAGGKPSRLKDAAMRIGALQ